MGTLFVGGFFVSPETVRCHDGSTDRKMEDMEWSYFIRKFSGDLSNNDCNMLVKKKNVKIFVNSEYLIRIGLAVVQNF